jgi:AbrB family looped-hinge helix DNA binding protein
MLRRIVIPWDIVVVDESKQFILILRRHGELVSQSRSTSLEPRHAGLYNLGESHGGTVEDAKILKNGQLVIPVHIRKKLGLKPGDLVKLFDYDGAIHIIPSSKNPVKEGIGLLPRKPSLSKKLLKERATE